MIDTNRYTPHSRLRTACEVAAILFCFAVFAGGPPPDVNEAHYLAKARHYWNPDWCAGDHFLESADAHQVFYWSAGWLTKFLSLPSVAHVGRFITWLLLAIAWQRLSFRLIPRRGLSILTANLFLVFVQHFHMAGEWVVGGFEAKGFAFVLLFFALSELIDKRWNRVWILLGMAASFHILVGGWSVVACGFAWVVAGEDRQPFRSMLPGLLAGGLLALPGLWPALELTSGLDAATVRQANEIYVFERLSHHLVFHQFPHAFMLRHAGMLVGWLILTVVCSHGWTRHPRFRLFAGELAALNRFVLGAVAIAGIGIVIDQSLLERRELAASLLRYYWFRLSDAVLPIGMAINLSYWFANFPTKRRLLRAAQMVSLSLAVLVCVLNLRDSFLQLRQDPRPRADRQSLSAGPDEAHSREVYAAWVNACQWIQHNTKPTDRFLTPRHQQTFKWYAHRSEVVSWKDVPQDAAGLVEWNDRRQRIYLPSVLRFGATAFTSSQLRRLAREFDFQYVLVDRTRIPAEYRYAELKLQRVYPLFPDDNLHYEIFEIPQG